MKKLIKKIFDKKSKKIKDQKKYIKNLENEISKLMGAMNSSQTAIGGLMANTRDMYFSPQEFILTSSSVGWKDVKISIGEEDITSKVSKLIISGAKFIELED